MSDERETGDNSFDNNIFDFRFCDIDIETFLG
jgi:hypothetical protein